MNSRLVGLCSWSLHPKNPRELVSACQACGIDHIQLALLPLVHEAPWKQCSDTLKDAGIRVLSGMLEAEGEDYTTLETIANTGGLRRDEMWQSTIEHSKRVADIAADMNLPMVTFHAGFIPEEQCGERSKMLDRLHEMTEEFASRGLDLGLETGQECAENVVTVLEELSQPNLGVNFDPANMILYGKGDPIEAIKALHPWVKQVHIKDAKATEIQGTWGTEVVAGRGDVPWETFLQLVPESVDLVIEREGGDNRIEDIKRAKAMLEEHGIC
ncbi:MAG: sugar phosphate isomerase/epimerase [Planctomycetes bacterium]|nr:sugar phosphate isomerase/epimerase [Planctomycetota bacterium]